jgi:energy-coupling factor transporter ATP-binding protein EcfA2
LRIVTIGHSGVGKTTYMASLYGSLQNSYGGFTLLAKQPDDQKTLRAIAESIRQGVYPPGTSYRTQYEFTLHLHQEPVIEFVWSDYGGSVLGGRVGEQRANMDISELQAELQKSDGLMMLVDGADLARGNMSLSGVRRMLTLVQHALMGNERRLSLAIVFTKADLLGRFKPEMLRPFVPIIDTVAQSGLVRGALITTACGRYMQNVPLPLLFALHTAVNSHMEELDQSHRSLKSQAADWQRRSEGFEGFIDVISSWWNGLPTNGQMAESRRRQADEVDARLRKVRGAVEALSGRVQNMALILPGRDEAEYLRRLNVSAQL